MAYSPEPWAIVDAELMRGVPGKAIVSARGDPVAFVYHVFADVEEDNAALLHAAPKLLTTCKLVLEELERAAHDGYSMEAAVMCRLALQTIIAEAEQ